jgi:hypothetical protein
MDINIKIKIESPELMAALLAFAEALPQMQLDTVLPIKEGQSVEVKESEIKTESNNEESLKEKVKILSLEEVRERLADISRSGKKTEVNGLINKYGAKKFTDIDSACYEELLKEAEKL